MTELKQKKDWTEPFTLGGLTAKPGERVHGFIELGNGEFSIPAAILRGRKPGKTMLITGAVHAGEYVGVQSAVELATELDIGKIHGNVIILKAISREAFECRKGSISIEDTKDLNRVFPGDENGTVTQRLSSALVREVLSQVDYQIDLHSGDDYEELTPHVYYAGKASSDVVEISRRMAQQVDVPYMVRSNIDAGGFFNYAGKLGIPGVLLERGSMGCWTMEEVRSMRRDIQNILIELDLYQEERDYREYYPLDVVDLTYQSAAKFGLWYPQRKPGDLFHQKDMLGYVTDYEGNLLECVTAEYDGVILYQTGSLQVVEDGPMITYGRIVRERKDERKERITSYWTKRSDSFKEQRRHELHDPIADRWLTQIHKSISDREHLRILDVGCGAGFFTILLAKEGHQVTGVDLTPDMVEHARELAQEEGVACEFQVMDAEHLDFPSGTFDLVISRNVVWTLPHADEAYRDWVRVLKADGILLNFDANYGAVNDADASRLPKNHAHNTIGTEMMLENEAIKKLLSISGYARPAWDLQTLGELGIEQFYVDKGVGRKIYLTKDEFFNPTPIFMISAQKGA